MHTGEGPAITAPRSTDPDPDLVRTRVEFAAALTALRGAAGLTIRELAARSGVPSATVGGYLSGRHLPPATQPAAFRALLAACGVTDPAQVQRWIAALGRARQRGENRGERGPAPYRGLAPFEPQDQALFFGRAAATRQVLDRLAGATGGVLFVLGPSGSGKSSLLRAGVVPAVRGGTLGGDGAGRRWSAEVITPGDDPAAALRGCLAAAAAPAVLVLDQFEEVFTLAGEEQRRELFAILDELDPADHRVVLGMRADFFAAAAAEPALVRPLQEAQVVVAPLTEDELREVIVAPARAVGAEPDEGLVDLVLSELLPRGRRAPDPGVLPLLSHALLATWERAGRNRLTIADYLSSGGIAGAVQQTAEDLYAELIEPERELTHRIFLRLVTVDEQQTATRRRISRAELDDVVATLGDMVVDADSVVARFVDRRLITAGAETIEITHEALLSAWPRLRDWLEADRDDVRLHHQLTEAANAWAAAGHDDELLLRGARLAAANEWSSDERNRALLNRTERDFVEAGQRAAREQQRQARRRTRRLQQLLAAVVVLALAAAGLGAYGLHAGATADHQRAVANRVRDEALSRQVAVEVGEVAASDPSLAAQLALAAYRISPTVDARSALLDTTARAPVTRLTGPPGPTALALDAGHGVLAVGDARSGGVRLYRMHGGAPPTLLATVPGRAGRQVFALAFSPDGGTLAEAVSDGQVLLWDVVVPGRPRAGAVLDGFTRAAEAVAFSPDGRLLAAAGTSPAARVWDVGDPALPQPLPALAGIGGTGLDRNPLVGQSVAFSPDGRRLALGGSDGRLHLWDLSGHLAASDVPVSASPINALAFSPDGALLAVGDRSGAVRVLAPAPRPHQVHAPLTGFSTWVNTLAFSPDGTSLAAGSADRTVRVWDVRSWQQSAQHAAPGPITGLAYTGDSDTMITTSADGSARLWPVRAPGGPRLNGPIFAVGYDRGGARLDLATTGPGGEVRLEAPGAETLHPLGRALPSGAVPRDIRAADGTSAITADGRTVAIGTGSGAVSLWDVADPARPAELGAPFAGATAAVESVAFSPGGTLLAVGSDDGSVHVWDVTDPARPVPVSAPAVGGEAMSVAFSPDGRLLAAASTDDTVRLFRIGPAGTAGTTAGTSVRPVATLTGFSSYAWAVTFSPDSRLLAAAGADHTALLWDVSGTPRRVGTRLTGPTDYASTVAFSPDGTRLAVGSDDGTVWLWDVRRPAAPVLWATLRAASGPLNASVFRPGTATLVAAGGSAQPYVWTVSPGAGAARGGPPPPRPPTPAEWAQYVQGAAYRPPCR